MSTVHIAWQVEQAALAIDCPRHGVPAGTWCPIRVVATDDSEPGVVCVPRRKATAAVRVTVCDSCLTESCWQGVLMCENARKAGTVSVQQTFVPPVT